MIGKTGTLNVLPATSDENVTIRVMAKDPQSNQTQCFTITRCGGSNNQ